MGNALSGETTPGPAGPQGIQGLPGSPGKAGKDGVGLPGSPGKDGKDGAADPAYLKTNSMWCANGEMCSIGSNGINFASKMTGQEAVAGHIAYRKYDTNALDIVGAGLPADGVNGTRKVKVWDHLDVAKKLTVNGVDVLDKIAVAASTGPKGDTGLQGPIGPAGPIGPQGIKGDTGTVTANNGILVQGKNPIRLGDGVAGKEGNAGSIGYQTFSNALDIVGAGTVAEGSQRKVRIYDRLLIGNWTIYEEDGEQLVISNNNKRVRYTFHPQPGNKPVDDWVWAGWTR